MTDKTAAEQSSERLREGAARIRQMGYYIIAARMEVAAALIEQQAKRIAELEGECNREPDLANAQIAANAVPAMSPIGHNAILALPVNSTYVPTTLDIRSNYVMSPLAPSPTKEAEAAFERWLAAERREMADRIEAGMHEAVDHIKAELSDARAKLAELGKVTVEERVVEEFEDRYGASGWVAHKSGEHRERRTVTPWRPVEQADEPRDSEATDA